MALVEKNSVSLDAEAHGREELVAALARFREHYPDDDSGFASDMARVRAWTNAEEPVRDPWKR